MSTCIEGEDPEKLVQTTFWFERALSVYLGFPVLLFIVSWLNAGAATFNALLLIIALFLCWQGFQFTTTPNLQNRIRANVRAHVGPYIVLFLWCCFSGIGGAGFQNTDYAASNALLKDLIESNWPLLLSANKPLVYYVTYYLPAALAGKLFSWEFANIILFMWSFLGLALTWNVLSAALDLGKISHARKLIATLVFILFGGWDSLGVLFNDNYTGQPIGTHIEWWAEFAQLSSHTTLFYWVPQHVIAPWLLTAYLLFLFKKKHNKQSLLLFAAFCFLWSPIASLGLLPFLVVLLIREFRANRLVHLEMPNSFFIAPIFAALGVLFYSSNSLSFPHHWQFNSPGFWVRYIQLIVLEILPMSFAFFLQHAPQKVFLNQISLPPPLKLSQTDKWLGWTAIATLLILPTYKFGIMNDLTMRASIPAIFILCSFYLRILRSEFSFQFQQIIPAALCLLIGTGASVSEIVRSAENFTFRAPRYERVSTLKEQGSNDTIEQRAGKSTAVFWKWLSALSQCTPDKSSK